MFVAMHISLLQQHPHTKCYFHKYLGAFDHSYALGVSQWYRLKKRSHVERQYFRMLSPSEDCFQQHQTDR